LGLIASRRAARKRSGFEVLLDEHHSSNYLWSAWLFVLAGLHALNVSPAFPLKEFVRCPARQPTYLRNVRGRENPVKGKKRRKGKTFLGEKECRMRRTKRIKKTVTYANAIADAIGRARCGLKLKTMRERACMSRVELGDLLDVSGQFISMVESGVVAMPQAMSEDAETILKKGIIAAEKRFREIVLAEETKDFMPGLTSECVAMVVGQRRPEHQQPVHVHA
jgi:DNA-binding XRE family transcriptional regulator